MCLTVITPSANNARNFEEILKILLTESGQKDCQSYDTETTNKSYLCHL